jgi:cardiolipin synthase
VRGTARVQLLPGGPDKTTPLFYSTALQLIMSAQKSVCCVTPYFIPDYGLSHGLKMAAKRGVNVKLVLPTKIDWMPVLMASRSYFEDLLAAGVQIYQYPPVLLHAKMLIVDEKWLILGSSNMDLRSFYINFELDFLIREEKTVAKACSIFEEEVGRSKLLRLDQFSQRSIGKRLVENTVRIFSPML